MVDDGKHLMRPIVRVADIYLVWHQSEAITEVHGRDMQSYGSKIDTCALFPSSHYQTEGKKKETDDPSLTDRPAFSTSEWSIPRLWVKRSAPEDQQTDITLMDWWQILDWIIWRDLISRLVISEWRSKSLHWTRMKTGNRGWKEGPMDISRLMQYFECIYSI